jgi:hypothetical protein
VVCFSSALQSNNLRRALYRYEEQFLKNILLVVLIIFGLVGSVIKLYFMAMPEIVVTNSSGIDIKVVTIELPKNRIVFDTILNKESSTIYYNLSQPDGSYKYTITFESEKIIRGECGYITNSEVGKVFHLTINNMKEVTCSG